MIARDEQELLAETIESAGSLADEIIVLDTGSTDRTCQLAAELGATVHSKPWANDFAAARNQCQRFVTGDWVLWLNAGEALRPDAADILCELIANNEDTSSAYALWIEAPTSEPDGSAEQRTEIRLYPTAMGLRFMGRVRESVVPLMSATAAKSLRKCDARIVRQQPRYSPERAAIKAQRDWALATREAESGSGWTPRLALAAGEAQSVLGGADQAREMFRRVLADPTAARAERLEAHYGLLSTFDADPELHASQLTACLDALEAFPFDLQLLLALGNYMLVRERLDLAVRALDAAVRFGEVTESVWHLREVREITAICLSSALQARQNDMAACDTLETAIEKSPQSLRLALQLVPVYQKLGRNAEANTLMERFSIGGAASARSVANAIASGRQFRVDTRSASHPTETSRRAQPAVS
jgi:tetratricopeptide (TPR) repeat protein